MKTTPFALALFAALLFVSSPTSAAVLFDAGSSGNTFGVFGAGTETINTNDVLAEGSGGSFPIMLGMSRGAFDLTAIDGTDELILTGFKDTNGTSTVTNASLRLVDGSSLLVARWNFDLTADLPTSLGSIVIGTIGSPNVTGGGNANAVTTLVFQAETSSAGVWDFTVDAVSTQAIPEPSAFALIGLGMVGLMARRSK